MVKINVEYQDTNTNNKGKDYLRIGENGLDLSNFNVDRLKERYLSYSKVVEILKDAMVDTGLMGEILKTGRSTDYIERRLYLCVATARHLEGMIRSGKELLDEIDITKYGKINNTIRSMFNGSNNDYEAFKSSIIGTVLSWTAYGVEVDYDTGEASIMLPDAIADSRFSLSAEDYKKQQEVKERIKKGVATEDESDEYYENRSKFRKAAEISGTVRYKGKNLKVRDIIAATVSNLGSDEATPRMESLYGAYTENVNNSMELVNSTKAQEMLNGKTPQEEFGDKVVATGIALIEGASVLNAVFEISEMILDKVHEETEA